MEPQVPEALDRKPDRQTSPVSENDLFAVCAHQYGYSEPLARVLSNVLFWSQFPGHRVRGQLGIFKTDAELAKDVHKHPKTVGRLLREVCAPAEIVKRGAVFSTRYAPRPWDPSGRVRWLFRTELGNEIIDAAKTLAKARLNRKTRKQTAATDRREMQRSSASKRCERSPQIAATHIIQRDCSDSQTETLSSGEAERETDSYEEKDSREGIEKFASFWNTACEECNRPKLAWRPSEVSKWSAGLGKFIQEMGVFRAADEEVMARLRLLAGDLEWLRERMSHRFMDYNSDGLLIESFVRYGTKLWLAAEKRLAQERQLLKFQASQPRVKSLKDYDISPKAKK